jgi:bifunctional UDP-N-acetylglucosamine pyrophosphorylase/glucosamine-1-phosphate N-acetyltransferase
METDPHIVILAGGRGKELHSRRPQALQPVIFRPMVHYVVDLASRLAHRSLSMVVGPGADEIQEQCRGWKGLTFLRQEAELGTGHAVKTAEPLLKSESGPVLILSADVILLTPASLKRMLDRHVKEGASCTIGTTALNNPRGYGRIVREIGGRVVDVREEEDCTSAERAINEVNSGIYVFEAADLFKAIDRVTYRDARHGYCLPSVVKALAGESKKIIPCSFGDPNEVLGVDDPHALFQVECILQERINKELMHRGVTLQDPRTTWIDPRCLIGKDVRIEGGCVLINSVIEPGVTVESHCRIADSAVGAGSLVKQGSYIEDSVIGPDCSVGPYAHLRPASRLGAGVKVGNFVEIKASTLGDGSKASHLSYIGDAEVGKKVNFGCGFITCNFDGGPHKHKTIVEDGVFIGSDCQAVAPVRIGQDSYIAAGTTVTDDVPDGSMAISRGRQTTKWGYAKKYRRPDGVPAKLQERRAAPSPADDAAPASETPRRQSLGQAEILVEE